MTAAPSPLSRHGGNAAARWAIGHALVVIVFLAWRFGGMEQTARNLAGWLLLAAPVITWFAWRHAPSQHRRKFCVIMLPLSVLALVVVTSSLNPSMRVLFSEGRPAAFVDRGNVISFLPSTIWPADTLRDFAFNTGLVLVGLNLFLARPDRGLQRTLLAVVAINAALLAVAGSMFKLGRATEIFGAIASPNRNFFASFVYYNHWGAFALLGAGAAAALAFHYHQKAEHGEWQHTPAPFFGVLTLLLLVSLPLSGARASTAAGLVFAGFLVLRLAFSGRGSRARGSRWLLVLATFAVAAAGTAWIARDSLQSVWKKTSTQIGELRGGGLGEGRLLLNRDTARLIAQRPVFGWGWNSYRYAFHRVQSADFRMENEQKTRTTVLDAHNDWLQLLAELGAVGGILALATVAAIARVASPSQWRRTPVVEILAALACLGLLAVVDFPFACPVVVATAWVLAMTAAAVAADRERKPGA